MCRYLTLQDITEFLNTSEPSQKKDPYKCRKEFAKFKKNRCMCNTHVFDPSTIRKKILLHTV